MARRRDLPARPRCAVPGSGTSWSQRHLGALTRWRGLSLFLVGLLLGLVACPFVVTGLRVVVPALDVFGSNRTTTTREGIQSIRTERQVVLLRLGIDGVTSREANGTILGHVIPGSERATYLQHHFDASLGFDGRLVRIEQAGPHAYRVSVPGFVFIGHSDVRFTLLVEDDGLLSAVTPKIDTVDMVNTILDDKAQAGYVDKNREILQEQARQYYASLVAAVDPSATVDVRFG